MNTKELFDEAIFILSSFILETTKDTNWYLVDTATNNYTKFMEQGMPFHISREGCKNTIYGNEMVNILSRVWHDRTHFENKFDFTIEGEFLTYNKQQIEIYNAMFIDGIPHRVRVAVTLLLDIEINEQRQYYEETGRFVENQYEFVYNKFKERIENGLT